jgi:hypothetical protein
MTTVAAFTTIIYPFEGINISVVMYWYHRSSSNAYFDYQHSSSNHQGGLHALLKMKGSVCDDTT